MELPRQGRSQMEFGNEGGEDLFLVFQVRVEVREE
jgi:hypothetical protein